MYKNSFFALFLITVFLISQTDALNKAFCQCRSKVSNRIIGGEYAERSSYPWTISLGLLPDTPWEVKPNQFAVGIRQNVPTKWKESTHICGGAIISENLVLTAAHCVTDEKLNIKSPKKFGVGAGNHNNLIEIFDHGRVPVRAIYVHPLYNVSSKDTVHDIAIVRLAVPLRFNSKSIMPACFLQENEGGRRKYYDEVVATGWGSTQVMRFSFITRSWQGYKGSQQLKEATFKDMSRSASICKTNKKLICIGPLDALHVNESVCKGDSGGSLHYTLDGYTFVVGVTSFGSTRKTGMYSFEACTGEAGYTRIQNSMDWIKSIAGNNMCLFEDA